MSTQNSAQGKFEDTKVSLKTRLAALWASFMFFYLYVDYFHLYMPGSLKDMLAGKVFTFQVSQTFLLIVLAAVTIPVLMIFLSTTLPAKINRWTNIIVAVLHIPYMLFNLAGGAWIHMVFGAVIEVGLLCLIIRYAWKWPRIAATHSTEDYK
ncbi:MAG: DUF6326 family protein [Bacteroidia bacterium]|jgi:hypothetical protein|nr:DUF6326 family protein [Bacteroidia bacterium]